MNTHVARAKYDVVAQGADVQESAERVAVVSGFNSLHIVYSKVIFGTV